VIEGSADGFRRYRTLEEAERERLRAIVGAQPVFRLYLESAIEAAAAGDLSRSVLIGRAGEGAALAIEFDEVTVRTVAGTLDDDELTLACAVGRRAELHVPPALRAAVIARCGTGVLADQSIRYYRRPVDAGAAPDPRCRRLDAGDYAAAAELLRTHHPATVFSRWMLDDTLIGLFEDGELVACGGVIARHRGLSTVILGNFVTASERRGQGLARAVMRSLLASLHADGIGLVTLCATAENRSACRSYEAMGFVQFDECAELVVGPG
jgi:ribosomal protein S18 acetylase RimI-like enzyme